MIHLCSPLHLSVTLSEKKKSLRSIYQHHAKEGSLFLMTLTALRRPMFLSCRQRHQTYVETRDRMNRPLLFRDWNSNCTNLFRPKPNQTRRSALTAVDHSCRRPEMCRCWNVASASVRGFWPQIRIPIPHSPHRLPAAAVCPVHLSLASWVTEEQLTAAAAEHGHGVTQIEHVRQHYTIASAHCAQQVSLPSAKLELMIRVSPLSQIFGGELSASVRGSQEFLRICIRRRMRPPSAHLCHRPPWPSAGTASRTLARW